MPSSSLLPWLRLFRIPNVFTALADIFVGYAIVQQAFTPVVPLVLLLVASACLYTAGMVLNDVFDVEQDTRERPHRPIPSGAISFGTARAVGFALLGTGVLLGAAAGIAPGSPAALPWRSGVVALALAISVVLYDMVLKRTPAAPVVMGLCRFFNVLLGASIASADDLGPASFAFFTPGQLIVAAAIGVYVVGITLFARTEATQSRQAALFQGLVVMGLGLSLLLLVPGRVPQTQPRPFDQDWFWSALVLLLAASVVRHCITAIANPEPAMVQYAVKFALLSIITFDAATTLWAAGPYYALGVFAMVIPAMLLGRIVYST